MSYKVELMEKRNTEAKILVLDLETTDLKSSIGDIVEIGAVLLDAEGTIVKAIDVVIRPTRPVDKWRNCWCLRNTSLTVEDVLAGQTLEEIRDPVQGFLSAYPVVSYNRDFDTDYLVHNGFEVRQRVACPMVIATNIMKLPGGYGKYRWPKFQAAWEYFFPDDDYRPAHRAFDDAWHVAQLVYKLKELGYYGDLWVR